MIKGFAKVLLILTVVLGALSADVANGARIIDGELEGNVHQPQTFGSIGGGFPSPVFPSPGLGGSFPSPGFSGSFPGSPLGGSFAGPPGPGLGGSFPGLGLGPSSFCSFPGVLCAPPRPDSPTGPSGGGDSVRGSP